MKLRIRQPLRMIDGSVQIKEVQIEDITIPSYCLLSIDGSTSNTGMSIVRESDGALLYSISAERDKKDKDETPVRFKIRLKRAVRDILVRNKFIQTVAYEEPVIHNITAVANLFMLRTFVEEMIIENEPEFNYIKHIEVPNMRWKKEFLAPDKVPIGTDNQKMTVRNKVEAYLPFLKDVTQDEIDSYCMGFVVASFIRQGKDITELESQKKAHAFKYNVIFIGADTDDDALTELWDIYKGPKTILENGISLTEIDSRRNFEKHIYETMGADNDKLLIIKFKSNTHGDVVLKHKVGNLSAQYEYVYAIVWRVTRK